MLSCWLIPAMLWRLESGYAVPEVEGDLNVVSKWWEKAVDDEDSYPSKAQRAWD